MNYNPTYFEMIKEAETKAEKKSIKDRLIKDIKRQEYPKNQTKEMITYIKTL
jgi:hypothetical protein